jgi:MoaA/NifB/PqqE/SkfB family radical SAM enzyme
MNAYLNELKILKYSDRICGNDKRPITAQFFLTDFCDLDCDFCRFKHGKGYISLDRFINMYFRLDSMGVKGYILTGGGEPMLNPDFNEIVAFLDSQKAAYGVNTHLPMVFPKNKPKWVKVSVHGDMVGGDYEKRLLNLDSDTLVTAQRIIYTPEELRLFFDQFQHEYCFDYLIGRPLESLEPFYTPEVVDEIMATFTELNDQYGCERIIPNFKWGYVFHDFKRCYADWSLMTILTNGDVAYCCCKPDEVIGNIFEPGILFKRQIAETNMATCHKPCRHTGNNAAIEKFFTGVQKHSEFI